MVSKKSKRKIEYEGKTFYWCVRANDESVHKIHILTEDKKVHLEYPFFDSEIPVSPSYIKHLLKTYLEEQI